MKRANLKEAGEFLIKLSEVLSDENLEETNIMTAVAGAIIFAGIIDRDLPQEVLFERSGENEAE